MVQLIAMDPLQLSDHVVALFNMSQCVICSPVGRFLYHVIAQLQRAHFRYFQSDPCLAHIFCT